MFFPAGRKWHRQDPCSYAGSTLKSSVFLPLRVDFGGGGGSFVLFSSYRQIHLLFPVEKKKKKITLVLHFLSFFNLL